MNVIRAKLGRCPRCMRWSARGTIVFRVSSIAAGFLAAGVGRGAVRPAARVLQLQQRLHLQRLLWGVEVAAVHVRHLPAELLSARSPGT